MSIREGLAASFLAAGLAGLLTLGTVGPTFSIANADFALTSVLVCSIAAIIIATILFWLILRDARRFKEQVRTLLGLQHAGLLLLDRVKETPEDEDDLDHVLVHSLIGDIGAWVAEATAQIKKEFPEYHPYFLTDPMGPYPLFFTPAMPDFAALADQPELPNLFAAHPPGDLGDLEQWAQHLSARVSQLAQIVLRVCER